MQASDFEWIPGVIARRSFRTQVVVLLCMLSLCSASRPVALAQNIRSIAVGTMGSGTSAGAMRQRIIARLAKTGKIQVTDETTADGILRGTSDIWATGSISLNPHSNSYRQTNYQGYLSIELVNRNHQLLWSYLVTPARYRTGTITDDLADHAVMRLMSALAGGEAGPAPLAAPGNTPAVALHAAGATLPAPLYLKWFEAAGVRVSYDAVGSEAGLKELANGAVDFAASDILPTDKGSGGGPDVLAFPTVLGAVVPIYNVPGLDRDLHLTPEALAAIYAGKVKRWDDVLIKESNRGAHLPNAEIAVVHRSDGSGTTFAWTSFLSLASSEWKAGPGAGTHVEWPEGTAAAGNGGVADLVKRTANSIGYVELNYAIQHELSYAAVRNAAGHFIKADLATITSAALGAEDTPTAASGMSLLSARARDAYPISTFTWLLVPRSQSDPAKKKTIADLLAWMLTAGQRQCSSLGYPPLPKDIAAKSLEQVNALR